MKELLEKQKTMFISSLDENNLPQASYAPYVMIEDRVYIYISEVAEHYRNLERNENVAFMIIEDESFSENLFVRKRVSFRGKAKKILDVPEDIKKKFEAIHGENMMNLLYKMDFNFFEINITSGRLVEGFGKAFDLIYENGEWKRENVFSEKANHR